MSAGARIWRAGSSNFEGRLISPGAVRIKVPVVRDIVGDGFQCGEVVACSLVLCLVWLGHGVFLLGLVSRKLGLPTVTQALTSLGAVEQ